MKTISNENKKLNYKKMARKITLMLALIGMITLQSCTKETVVQDTIDNDTISEVFEYSNNVNFTSSNQFKVVLTFPYTIYSDDMVLIYRLSGYDSSVGDYWKLLPETYFFPDGTLNFGYSNDFTHYDAEVTLFGNDLSSLNPEFRLNQVFRVLVIPANLNNRSANQVDFKDYNAVIDYYQINTNNITKIVL